MNSNARTIEVIIHTDGSTRIQTHGFAGRQCLKATHLLEQTLGLRTSHELTAEFHRRVDQGERQFEKP